MSTRFQEHNHDEEYAGQTGKERGWSRRGPLECGSDNEAGLGQGSGSQEVGTQSRDTKQGYVIAPVDNGAHP